VAGRFRALRDLLLHPDRFERELDGEIRRHLEDHIAELVESGVPRREAERRARLSFGGVAAVKEECREAAGLAFAFAFLRDLRYGFRLLRRNPGFAAVGVALLALCVGANTAVFGIADTVLFRPLPYPQPDRLGWVVTANPRWESVSLDGRAWETIRDGATGMEVAAFSDWTTGVNLLAAGRAEFVRQQKVSAGFFETLGVDPALGRSFLRAEDVPGGPAVVVLSHDLWRRTLGADPGVVGADVFLRGEACRVIGVMPEGFRSTARADLWAPLRPSTVGEGSGTNYAVVARLGKGTSWSSARGRLEALGRAHHGTDHETTFRVVPLGEVLAAGTRRQVGLLWAAVGLVLLIGCANLAGLQLARSSSRSFEIATRAAIGGGRWPILRQLVTEGLALALCGSALGLALGAALLAALRRRAADFLGLSQEPYPDLRVLAVAGTMSLAVAVLFSLYPAWRSSRPRRAPFEVSGWGRSRLRGGPSRLLVLAEVALAVVLLSSAVLLVRSFNLLHGVEPGFRATGLMTATASLQDARYATATDVVRLFERSLASLRREPGVAGAAVTLSLPYERPLNMPFQEVGGDAEPRTVNLVYVSPGYFRVIGAPILAGRPLRAADGAGPPVVLVNRAFVTRHLAGRPPLGARLGCADREWEVVGVVGDIVQARSFGDVAPLTAAPTLYVHPAQMPDSLLTVAHGWFSPSWVVRGTAPEAVAEAALRRGIEAADPALPVAMVRSMEQVARDTLSWRRFYAALMSALAAMGMALAAVGVGGLVTEAVAARHRDLAIRLALGARRPRAFAEAVLPGLLLAAVGLGIGSALSPMAAHALGSTLWGVAWSEPETVGAVAVLVLAVAASSSLVPALRVARLDPARVLRSD
jgi:predicted permease